MNPVTNKAKAFTPMPTIVLEKIIEANLTKVEYKIILLIARKTWGFRKKDDWISNTQFVEYTGADGRIIRRAIALLIKKKIILHEVVENRYSKSKINLNTSEWEVGQNCPRGRTKRAGK